MARAPLRVFTFDPMQLSTGEMIEAAELTGVDPLNMAASEGPAQMRWTAALAWIYNRSDDPALTFEDVLAGKVEVAKNGTVPPEQPAS